VDKEQLQSVTFEERVKALEIQKELSISKGCTEPLMYLGDKRPINFVAD